MCVRLRSEGEGIRQGQQRRKNWPPEGRTHWDQQVCSSHLRQQRGGERTGVNSYASVAPVWSPPLPTSTWRTSPLLVPRIFLSQVSVYPVFLHMCYRLSRPCFAPSIAVFWCIMILGLFFFRCLFACWREAREPPFPGNSPSHPSLVWY